MAKSFEALFINGVPEAVLADIVKAQQNDHELVLYLQPYAGGAMARFRRSPPSIDSPVKLFACTTGELNRISFVGEIIGWRDKSVLTPEERGIISKVLGIFQPTEKGVYDASASGRPSVDLLMVRRVKKLSPALGVELLVKSSDGEPLSPNRSRSGGWSYVNIQEGVTL